MTETKKTNYGYCEKCGRRFLINAEEHFKAHLPYCEKSEEKSVNGRRDKKSRD